MSDGAVTVKRYSEENYNELNFESIKIGLASPESIREWSYGEVTKPETINYRTLKPEMGGLFCEKIFGPVKDWECHCGKYKRVRFKGKTCEKCGVKITKAKVRRERMGHIELACPVSHIWYFKGIPSRIGLMLDVSPRDLDKVLYFAKYIVVDPGDTPLEKYAVISDKEYDDMAEKYDADSFDARMGAEAIKDLLAEIDVEELAAQLRAELETANGQKRARILKRLEVVDAFRLSGNKPEWMILDVIPVIPPDIRPMVQLDGGRFATSDLNDLYRRVINRNNRLKKLIELGSPEIILRNEKRMLQEAVDALIDNGRHGRPVTGPNNRPLKSLSDMLKGKQGRFRQNLLGKRVDYSGRSVIVVGPELKIYQCGLPKEMALELFKPFVMKRLVELEISKNIKNARKMVDKAGPEVWDALETVIKDHPVMLNRAPTLHRLGIQAFEPILVEGRAIKLHPLVCTAFNADFDGDQMAVHVPLSSEAQAEARFLMLAANNLLKPSDGKPVTVPTQDMVLGSYYLTTVRENERGAGHVYKDEDEAVMAYEEGSLQLHAPIKIRFTKEINGVTYTAIVPTTLGKVIFNRPVPQDLGFVTRDPSDPASMVQLEVDFLVEKKALGKIIEKCISVHGTNIAADVLDKIKNQGYRYSTVSGITVSVFDAIIPETKRTYIDEAQAEVDEIMKMYRRGKYSDMERSTAVIKVWNECTTKVSQELKDNLDLSNPIHMMIHSGARGSASQLNQLAGMRGLIANTAGQTIEIPIKSNYREGLSVVEYFISSRGARKGLADTALRTADSGYLTRRLVDVSQEVIIRENDCGCTEGLEVSDIYGDEDRMIESLQERLTGRYLLNPLTDENGELIMDNEHMMTENDAKRIVEKGFKKVVIRSLLTCEASKGVCKKCYGRNLATGRSVSIGEAVGIIAAQSIGEPGTQLTMRTFHTGGVTTTSDITQGLPRVEELFEARKPKTLAILARIGGTVSFVEGKKGAENILITGEEGREEYTIPYGFRKTVEEGDVVEKGRELTEGSVNPHDILEVLGVEAVHNYLIREVQKTYRTQGVDVNDKHIEVIIRQMMRKVRVIEPGDTKLLPGASVDKSEFKAENAAVKAKAEAEGYEPILATCEPVLLGITKASLATDSFLSAASFQETTRVLTDAAIKGKVDPLLGLKENVIIGKLLPSGTGMRCYADVQITPAPITVHADSDYSFGNNDEN
ncbi:MAG: DNA-directed RNA polymerase subunit beta' [Clostridia bacterium]|nr:DNA-directed RNA polymerase subunit beta' [Clostridia bacterium]